MRKKNKPPRIRDTDIVYPLVTDDGERIRMSLHKDGLHGLYFLAPSATEFSHRVVFGFKDDGLLEGSCLCEHFDHPAAPDVRDSSDADSALDWLAAGEPGRGEE